MKPEKGKLFVFEGGDGTGKTDQHKKLVARLSSEGYKVAEIDFPRYGTPPQGHPASYFERKYLIKKEFGFERGYGPANLVNPYAASLQYAVDRFDASFSEEYGDEPNLWDLLNDDHILVSNRYTQSNIAYQASRIKDREERIKFIQWLYDLEYEKLGIPEPNLVILLDLEPELAMELKVRQRREQGIELDDLEKDLANYVRSTNAYLEALELFANSWVKIEVGRKVHSSMDILAGMHTREVIHEKIWSEVKKYL